MANNWHRLIDVLRRLAAAWDADLQIAIGMRAAGQRASPEPQADRPHARRVTPPLGSERNAGTVAREVAAVPADACGEVGDAQRACRVGK